MPAPDRSTELPSLTLGALGELFPLEVRRDASFATLGFLAVPLEGMLTFVAGERWLGELAGCPQARAVLTTPELAARVDPALGLAVCEDPQGVFLDVHDHLARATDFYWRDFPTQVDPTAEVHPAAAVAARNVRVGPRSVVGPHVTLQERTEVGADVVLHPGVVLGSEGFQLVRREGGIRSMVHRGGTRVADGAVVLAGAVIASGLFRQWTVLGAGSWMGNLAFLSHNSSTGPACILGHGSVVNGNVSLGARVWIGPNASVGNNLAIGDDAFVCLGATVLKSVEAGQRILGPEVAAELARRPKGPPERGGS